MIPIGQRQLAEIKPEFDFKANKFKDNDNISSSGFNSEFLALFQNSLSQNSDIAGDTSEKQPEYKAQQNLEKSNKTESAELSHSMQSEHVEHEEKENHETRENLKDARTDKKQIENKEVLATLLREKVISKKADTHTALQETRSPVEQETTKGSEVAKTKISNAMSLRETLTGKEKIEKPVGLKKPSILDLAKGASVAATTEITASAIEPKKTVQKGIHIASAKNSDQNQTQFEKIVNNSSEKVQIKNKAKATDQQTPERTDINPVKLSETAIVSRETISVNRDNKNHGINSNDSFIKLSSFEKPEISASLKSDMNSDLSSNQNQSGFSMNHTEKFNFMNKVNENPVLRQDMQQQIDQLLQRAKIIIRDNGNARLNARLNPKELGEISINLVMTDGKLKGRFTVDNSVVQKELQEKIEKLFAELKTEGYVIDGFQIDVKSETASDNSSKNPFLDSVRNEFNKNSIGMTNAAPRIYSSDDNLNSGGIYA